MPVNPTSIRRALLLWSWIGWFLFMPVSVQGSFIGDLPESERGRIMGSGLPEPGIGDDYHSIVDQLERVGIDDDSFFDFSAEREPGPGAFEVEVYGEGGEAPRFRYGFERGIRFDSGIEVEKGQELDKRATFDQGVTTDTGYRFDAVGGFDAEPVPRIEDKAMKPPSSGEGERVAFPIKKEDRLVAPTEGERRFETRLKREKLIEEAQTRERESLEEELLKSQELELGMVRPTRAFPIIKAGIFISALLFLLVCTLKRLIPFRFYFFLTILILILWNPMESLFISIIIGLSTILAPFFG